MNDPAVRMPAVPVLISENPTESGVISLTLHPGVAFGAGFLSFFLSFSWQLLLSSASHKRCVRVLEEALAARCCLSICKKQRCEKQVRGTDNGPTGAAEG